MDRINKEQLVRLKDSICTKTGIRHTLEGANGGWQLCRTIRLDDKYGKRDVDGAEKVFSWKGHMPKRELYDLMHAYLEGSRGFRGQTIKDRLGNYAPNNSISLKKIK